MIQNTGSTDAVIRAKVIPVWTVKNAAGALASGDKPEYTIAVAGWIAGEEKSGEDSLWYYYPQVVPPGEEVEFTAEIELTDDWEGDLELSFDGQAIQASNEAIETEWEIDWEKVSKPDEEDRYER